MAEIRKRLQDALHRGIAWAKATDVRTRLLIAAPVLTAALFAGMALLLDICLRDVIRPPLDASLHAVNLFFRLLVFLAPFTYVSQRAFTKLRRRLRDRRISEALLAGLWLPQLIAVLVVLYAPLAGSEVIASLFASIVTWAMLSLLLSPVTVVLALFGWSYLPKDMKLPVLVPAAQKPVPADPRSRMAPLP